MNSDSAAGIGDSPNMAGDPGVLADIGKRIQEIRQRLTMLQKDFAHQMGISSASLSEIEKGKAKPRFELFYYLTAQFNVNIYYILHGKGGMFLDENARIVDEPGSGGEDVERINEYREFLETFLNYFRKSSIFRYAVMTYFTAYLLENEYLIEKNLKLNSGDLLWKL
jgi:transcriptional regulator with XRE-family HTH domain